ncbi:MAG: nickel pincer cofactor biosynthesis protein LarB [Methanomassiliicoccales archaeon]
MSIREVLRQYISGELSEEEAEKLLRLDFLEKIGNHTVFDHGREARRGIPEIIFGESKSPAMVAEIVARAIDDREIVLVSRASEEHFKLIREIIKGPTVIYNENARLITVKKKELVSHKGKIGILAAGSSDITVAEEAKCVAQAMGVKVFTAYDVGVAGLHRILEPLKMMIKESVDAIIVVAGMEGALPSVVSGLTDVPVIGVPTSVGYGYGGRGEAALISMLQSCSPGLAVVNIDNGVGAGAFAALIARKCHNRSNDKAHSL